jgi:hypothetical protein
MNSKHTLGLNKNSYQLNEIEYPDRSPFIRSLKKKNNIKIEKADMSQLDMLQEIEEINARVGNDIGKSIKRT